MTRSVRFMLPMSRPKPPDQTLKAQVNKEAHLMTDETLIYKKVGREFAKHDTLTHSAG